MPPLPMHRAPPSMTRVWPVIHEAASEQRNRAACGDVLGLAEAAQREPAGDGLLARLPQGPGELGLDQTGSQGVDPHRGAQLAGQLAGQMDHGGLGDVVPADPPLHRQPADRGQVENGPAPFGHAGPPSRLDPLEVAGLVDPDGLVGPRRVEVDHRSVVRVGGGVVDQDVDPAEPVDGGGHAGVGLVGVAGVGHPPVHLAAAVPLGCVDLGRRLGQGVGLAGRDHHRGAGRGEGQGDGLSDAPGRPGHQCRLAVQS